MGILSVFCLLFGSVFEAPIQEAPIQKAIINEIYAAPLSGESEFIELIIDQTRFLSTGNAPAQISKLEIRDKSGGWVTIPLPNQTGGRDTLVVAKSPELVPGAFPNARVLKLSPWPSLNNGGDSLFVRMGSEVQDRVGYSQSKSGISLERLSENVPGHWESNWGWSIDLNGATPGRTNSLFKMDLSPPHVLGAEIEYPGRLLVWFSEPLPENQAVPIEIFASTGEHAFLEGHPCFNLISIPDVPFDVIEKVSVSGYLDFAGHSGAEEDAPVAYPPLQDQVYISEVHFWEGTNQLERFDFMGTLISPVPEFIAVATKSRRPISLRNVELSVSGKSFRLTHPDSLVHISEHQSYLALSRKWEFVDDMAELNATWLQDPENAFVTRFSAPSSSPQQGVVPDISLPNGSSPLELSLGPRRLDSVSYSQDCLDARFKTHKGRSLVRSLASNCGWYSSLTPTGTSIGLQATFADTEQAAEHGALVASEIMFDPIEDAFDGVVDQVEFIELVNTSPYPVGLLGVEARSYPDETGVSSRLFKINSPFVLSSKQVAIVYQVPSNIPENSTSLFQVIQEAWPSSALPFTSLFLPVRESLSLSNTSDRFQILSPSGDVIETISYSTSDHYPGLASYKGRSLFRMIDMPVNDALQAAVGPWTSTTHMEGATPGVVPEFTSEAEPSIDGHYSLRVSPLSFYPQHLELEAQTTIRMVSAQAHTIAKLEVFSREGFLVRTLEGGQFLTSSLITSWDGRDEHAQLVPTGVYLVVASFFDVNGKLERRIKNPVSVLRSRMP
jgi:hypothetical protein